MMNDELTALLLPDLGLGDQPIVLSLWLVRTGSRVAEGEPLVEVLAGAATVDLPSPAAGVLAEKSASAGDVLAVGQRLATIENDW
jgi:pyruvate/2-oxoglutarate dehydrogenase complex dihydrolipoamide acyltransferase (E2) component